MKETFAKRIISVLMTVAVVIALFYLYLPPQINIIESMNETVGKDRVDVLCVGSSHVFSGINPKQMFDDKGIAAYDLAIGSQAPWQSYYYIREACRFQKPKLIVFDTYMVGASNADSYQDYQTVNNLLDCPLSLNKISAVLASKADSKLNILLRFPYIYDKYENFYRLTTDKFYGIKDYNFGYSRNDIIEVYNDVEDVSEVSEVLPIDPKNEKYLRLIIEFCQKNGIDIVLTHTPWPCITRETQMRFNRVAEIADEYHIQFLDGCKHSKEIGMDYTTDSCGDGGHLNYSGVTKYTSWLEENLDSRYYFQDRREDAEYEVYLQE
ncbi:hypothetical protein [Butyrivibrio sp. NC2007]|uniref:hypothetical protein n=1 Tax=Butyrivibrio sp. NC2007 TaxID=1280683 RepID=UPI0003B45665|nr:hypothetical protein [Butyrivibrio sp. NC2007]